MMETQTLLTNLKEIQAFFGILHQQYDEALAHEDMIGLIEISGDLSAAYALLGNMPLARKWSEEHRVSLCRLNLEHKSFD